MEDQEKKEKLKEIVKNLPFEKKKLLFSNTVQITTDKMFYKLPLYAKDALKENIDINSFNNQVLLDELFPFKTKEVDVLLSPIFETGLEMDMQDYKEYMDCLDKLSELTVRAYQRMAACGLKAQPISEEIKQKRLHIRSNVKFRFKIQGDQEQEKDVEELKNFDINKFKK